jgi:hypothetical protein
MTIKGLISGFLAVFTLAVLTNVFYPFLNNLIGSNAPTGNYLISLNIAFALIGVGLLVWIIKDGLAGSREYEGYGI